MSPQCAKQKLEATTDGAIAAAVTKAYTTLLREGFIVDKSSPTDRNQANRHRKRYTRSDEEIDANI